MNTFWRLGPKIYSVVILLSLFTAAIGAVAISSFQQYNAMVRDIDRASKRAWLTERVNSMLYLVVMDSRGVYMSLDLKEAEKYSPAIISNLRVISGLVNEWTSLIRPEDKERMDRVNARIEEFIRLRTELVRLAREVNLVDARNWGDNDASRANRIALSTEMLALGTSNDKYTHDLTWIFWAPLL